MSEEPLGPDEQLLFEMPFAATGPRVVDDAYDVSFRSASNLLDVLANDSQLKWTTAFAADAADDVPAHDVLLSEPRMAVPADEILWIGTDVTIANDPDMRIVAVGPASSGGTVTISAAGTQLVYRPAADFAGTETWTYTVADSSGRTASATVVVEVARSWQNVRNPLDVDSDTFVSPIDALLVINYLNAGLPAKLEGVPSGPPFRDVNNDGFVSPIDALLVINYLHRADAGEGERAAPQDRVSRTADRSGLPDVNLRCYSLPVGLPDVPCGRTAGRDGRSRAMAADAAVSLGLTPLLGPAPARAADRFSAAREDEEFLGARLDELEELLELVTSELG